MYTTFLHAAQGVVSIKTVFADRTGLELVSLCQNGEEPVFSSASVILFEERHVPRAKRICAVCLHVGVIQVLQ